MKQTFEEYLQDIHAKHYTGTDDNMPDNFDNWLGALDTQEVIDFAYKYGIECFTEGQVSGIKMGSDVTISILKEKLLA